MLCFKALTEQLFASQKRPVNPLQWFTGRFDRVSISGLSLWVFHLKRPFKIHRRHHIAVFVHACAL